jgi:nucleolar pre-ribosomal-associated protein 2
MISGTINMIEKSEGLSSPKTRSAIDFLLDVPSECLDRSQREAIMKSLVPYTSDRVNAGCWLATLSLMVKVMGRPTFYEVSPDSQVG